MVVKIRAEFAVQEHVASDMRILILTPEELKCLKDMLAVASMFEGDATRVARAAIADKIKNGGNAIMTSMEYQQDMGGIYGI